MGKPLSSLPSESPTSPFAARRYDEETYKRLCLAREFIDDCRATYEELKQKGVEFMSPPQERPYGIEALMKDNSGNWFSMTQHQ
jgi:predicted enzyme related to lactoylglutathione lyase